LLGWLPRGTHDWNRFVRPSEFVLALRRQAFTVTRLAGLSYGWRRGEWAEADDLSVNFMVAATRRYYGPAGSGVGLDPGDAAELDALIGERPRFFGARLAIDRMRVGLAVMNAARLLGKALADIIAIGFDLSAKFRQRGAHLRR